MQRGGEDQGEQESLHASPWPSASRWPRLSVQAQADALVRRRGAVRLHHPCPVTVEKIITRLNPNMPFTVEKQDIPVRDVQTQGACQGLACFGRSGSSDDRFGERLGVGTVRTMKDEIVVRHRGQWPNTGPQVQGGQSMSG